MKDNKIDVLDHGFVRLVDCMGSDLSVVRAARVSYDAAWRAGQNTGSDERLIHYLWKHQHTSPFESVTFTFEVKAPIFVFRQWHRHRTWSFSEISARYCPLPEEFYLPTPEDVGKQIEGNKQAREVSSVLDDYFRNKRRDEILRLQQTMQVAFAQYHGYLNDGWPRELARIVLPLATYSHMFSTVNLLNLLKFLTLRLSDHAQYEIRVYAQALLNLIRPEVPVAVAAWEKYPVQTVEKS